MKKVILGLVCILGVNVFSVTSYVQAKTNENVEVEIYSEFENELNLTEEGFLADDPVLKIAPNYNLENLEEVNSDYEISTFAYPSDNPDSRKLTGILKRSYKNSDIKIATTALYNWGVAYVPTAIKKSKYFNFINAWVNVKILSAIKPTYVATWAWETHDYKTGNHIVYNTVVHYSDSSYSKVISSQYFEADRYPIYVNEKHYHKY